MVRSTPSAAPVALVTGASSGFGRLGAQALAQAGYRVFGTSRRDRPDEAGVTMIVCDVRDEDAVRRTVGDVEERAGPIDLLVNNAGFLHVGLVEETSLAEVRALFETNFYGVLRVTAAVLPGMRQRRRGRIINVSSLAGLLAGAGAGIYGASKGALEAYSEALYYEMYPFGVRVSIIEPGFYRTALHDASRQSGDQIGDYDRLRATVQRFMRRSIGEGGDPEEVARLIVRVAQARRPRLRYRVGADGVWLPFLKWFLPDWLFTMGVRHVYHESRLPLGRWVFDLLSRL